MRIRQVDNVRISLASYNIHGCIGRDGRYAPERILAVLRELDCDVVALQEVDTLHGGLDLLAYLAQSTSSVAVPGPTMIRADGDYGNAVLSRLPVLSTRRLDLTFGGREPRGAIGVDLDCGGVSLRAVATHLGLRPTERRFQVQRLLDLFRTDGTQPAALMGDLNEWFLWGRPLRWLHAYFGTSPAIATFPAGRPMLALDRILAHPRQSLNETAVHLSALARIASDHLPLKAVMEVAPLGEL
ncbi:MAG: endonuclease/exonuclease/phosphatase family protein [Betaproteobacteria bacterium]